MEGGFKPRAIHAAGFFDVALAVDLVFLGNYVNDFFSRHHGQFVHVFGEALQIELVDYFFGIHARDVVAVLKAANVLPCNAHDHSGYVKSAVQFGGFDGLLDGLDGLGDVDHHAALHPKAWRGSVAEDFELAVAVELTDQNGNFGGADVKSYGDCWGVHGWLGAEVSIKTTWSSKRTSRRSSWSRVLFWSA